MYDVDSASRLSNGRDSYMTKRTYVNVCHNDRLGYAIFRYFSHAQNSIDNKKWVAACIHSLPVWAMQIFE